MTGRKSCGSNGIESIDYRKTELLRQSGPRFQRGRRGRNAVMATRITRFWNRQAPAGSGDGDSKLVSLDVDRRNRTMEEPDSVANNKIDRAPKNPALSSVANRAKSTLSAETDERTLGTPHRNDEYEYKAGSIRPWQIHFRGTLDVFKTVLVFGSDGLLQHGTIINCRHDGLLIDFDCGENGIKRIPLEECFRHSYGPSFYRAAEHNKPFEGNISVTALARLRRGERWKWRHATLLRIEWNILDRGWCGFVRLGEMDDVAVPLLLRQKQIRFKTELFRPDIDLPEPAMPPMPLFPHHLLAEVFACFSPTGQSELRRVCSKWNDSIAADYGTVIYLCASGYMRAQALFDAWNARTRIIATKNLYDFTSRSYFSLLKFIVTQCKRRPLRTLVVCNDHGYCEYQTIRCTNLHDLHSAVKEEMDCLRAVSRYLLIKRAGFRVCLMNGINSDEEEPYVSVSFDVPIANAWIDLTQSDPVPAVWSFISIQDAVRRMEQIQAHFSSHGKDCQCTEMVLLALNKLQSASRGTNWSAEDLVGLDPTKLTKLCLCAVNYILKDLKMLW